MKMTSCDPALIAAFLADELDEQQQADFELHLDTCVTCCRALQRQTAHASLWSDARSFLSSSENPVRTPDDPVPCDATIASLKSPAPVNLDFLSPTDDPHMLGRFAGYEISGVVGRGGMGIVLKGFDASLNRYAAIKVLAPHYASSGAARQRFGREAQAAAAVVHDNVIAIHGVSEFNNLPYLIMPYIKGQSLQKRIDRHGPLSIPEILRIAMQTARGLAAAHDQGLVHRDIKPGNVLLPENVERVLITDFGLARAADDASLTRSGVIAGTPQYMSPEQAKGEGIDARSDLFSLGSMMYAMATGHPPFRAETPYGILRRITDHPHRPVQELRTDLPSWLCSVIDRLLAKDAAARFTSAEVVAQLLEDCLAHVQQPSQVPLPKVLQLRITPEHPGRRRLLGFMGLMSAIVIATAALWMSKSQFRSSPESTQASNEFESAEPGDSEEALTPTKSSVSDVPEFDLEWDNSSKLDQLEATLSNLRETLRD
ncbi:MAG: protein kinase [Planctomycetaceae bacterium]